MPTANKVFAKAGLDVGTSAMLQTVQPTVLTSIFCASFQQFLTLNFVSLTSEKREKNTP